MDHILSLCLSWFAWSLFHMFLFLYICFFFYWLSILTALFSPPILHISTHSFCFLITPPISLLFQNSHCCFLVFPSSISQRQRIWFAFLTYLYLWVEYVVFSCPILDKLAIAGWRYKTHPPRAVFCHGFWTQEKWCHNQLVMFATSVSSLKTREEALLHVFTLSAELPTLYRNYSFAYFPQKTVSPSRAGTILDPLLNSPCLVA